MVVVVAFSLLARILGEGPTIHSPPALLLLLLLFVLFVEISSYTPNSTFLCRVQSTMAQRAETIVAECSLTSCV